MLVCVTGVNGFVGKHLVRELTSRSVRVTGVGRERNPDSDISEFLQSYHSINLTQQWPEIPNADAVIHLAGLAAVGPSFNDPQSYINLNSAMVTHMAEYYLKQAQKPRLVVISSGAIYDPSKAMPLAEGSEIGLSSPYVVSKVLIENQCSYYRKRGLDCIVVRPFNHIGPGQLGGFLVPDVIKQLQEGDSLTVGNISTRRDYTDVRDIVRAYRLLATTNHLNHNMYNACSGRSTSGEEIVAMLKIAMHKKDVKITVDQSKVRPTDPPDIYGDSENLQKDTGWQPEISLKQTLDDILTETQS